MKKLVAGWVLILSVLGVLNTTPALPAAAQHPNNVRFCEFTQGPLSGHQMFLRYNGIEDRVSLVSYQTGTDMQTVETGFDTTSLETLAWFQSCRYLVAVAGDIGSHQVVVWDVLDNRRVGTLAAGSLSFRVVKYPEFGDLILLQSTDGAWLWWLDSNTQLQLTAAVSYNQTQLEIEWVDVPRAQLAAFRHDSPDILRMYDVYSGAEVEQFYDDRDGSQLYYLRDDNWLVTWNVDVSQARNRQDLTLWNRDTRQALTLRDMSVYRFSGVHVSPSGRYMLVNFEITHIFDLTQGDVLTAIGEFPLYGYGELRFVDEATIQTVSIGCGWWYCREYTYSYAEWQFMEGVETFHMRGYESDCYVSATPDPTIHRMDIFNWMCDEMRIRWGQ